MRFVKPKKALGQHFLNDISVAERIVESLSPSQNILEIGPGTGILTKILIKKKIDLKLVEIDKESVDFLTNELEINVSLIYNQDFLKMNLAEVFSKNNFSIIGNFPYNISSQIVFKIIDYRKYIPEMCGMFQYEVAERICEHEGSKKYGIISVITQAYYKTSLLFEVSNNLMSLWVAKESAGGTRSIHGVEPANGTDGTLGILRIGFATCSRVWTDMSYP